MSGEFMASVSAFFSQWGLIIIMVIGMILFMWYSSRKRKKQQKEYQEFLDSLQPGKRIKTIGGMYGKIAAVKDDLVIIELEPDKVKVVFSKKAISIDEDSEAEEKTIESK